MFQQTAAQPASNPAPAIEASTGKRRYRRHPADEMAAMRLAVYRGEKPRDVAARHDVNLSIVYKAVGDLPRPKQMPGENKWRYGARVKAWMLQIDPDYRERVSANRAKAARLMWRRKKRAAEKATVAHVEVAPAVIPEPAPPPPPVNIEAQQPVAATEPPWGFEPARRPGEIVAEAMIAPAPRVGFWRSVGMMLGIVR